MTGQYIPVFKKSSNATKDLINIKKMEMLSYGWLKGQYIYLMPRLFGTTTIDGKICYGRRFNVNGYTDINDNSEHAKDVRRFLSLLGMNESDFANIYKTYKSKGVDKVRFEWKDKQNFGERDFEFIFDIIRDYTNIKRIEFIQTATYYSRYESNRPAKTCFEQYANLGNKKISAVDSEGYISGRTELGKKLDTVEIKFYDENNIDISSSITGDLLSAFRIAIFIAGDKLIDFLSVEKLNEFPILDNENVLIGYNVMSKEVYDVNYNNDFVKYYNLFKPENEKDIGTTLLAGYWSIGRYSSTLLYDNTTTPLFYREKKFKKALLSKADAPLYMTIDGLQNCKPDDLIYYTSRFANFDIKYEEDDGGFLGIGGFVGNFLSSLVQAVASLANALSKIVYYIPQLRLEIQLLAWVFSGKWSNDRDRFVTVASRVLLAVIAIIITVYSGGSATSIAISLLSSAYGIYIGLDEFDEMVKNAENNQIEELEKKIQEKTLDFSGQGEEYDYLYEPYKRIDAMTASPFDNMMYNIPYGMKI